MEQLNEIRNFNSIVIKAFASSQDYLNILSNFSMEQQSPLLFVDVIFCEDLKICSEKTKYIAMKILTSYENNMPLDIIERLENYYINNFSSDNFNNSLLSSVFSIDLFASIFKQNPSKSIQILNNFFLAGDDRFPIVILYTIRFVKKIQKTNGFENILLNIFQNLPEMAATFDEMLSIPPIFRLLLPTIINQKIHFDLFEHYETNENVCKVLRKLLQLKYLFESNEQFNDLTIDYINIFNDIITNDSQLQWKTELLLDLRQTYSFRQLLFDQFYTKLIENIFTAFEFSIENFNESIEMIKNFINFFGILDQLGCNSNSEEASTFNKTVMENCRILIIENLSQIKCNDIDDLNSPFFDFFDQCMNLFMDDYITNINNLIEINSIPSFLIIKEMISNHQYKPIEKYVEFVPYDKNSFMSFLNLENKPINFFINFLTNFLKVYPPEKSEFHNEYYQALIILIENLQKTKNIDLEVLKNAVYCIDKIPIVEESELHFLIENPLFPFINQENNRKEMTIFFQKISNLSFIDQIVGSILSIQNLEPAIILDYLKEIPLDLLFSELIPVVKESFISITDPKIIMKFIYTTTKRVKGSFFPFMSEKIIFVAKSICEIINEISINNTDNFYVQKKNLKTITKILQFQSLNIEIFLFYEDDFLFNTISKTIELLCQFEPEIIGKDFKFILNYYKIFYQNLDFSSSYFTDESVFLFLKSISFQVQQNSFNFGLMKESFNILIAMIEADKIVNPVEGITDSLLEECLKKGYCNNLPISMYLVISVLFKIHQDILTSFVQSIGGNSGIEGNNIDEAIEAVLNGTEDQIVNASQFLIGLAAENVNSIQNQ